MLSPLMLLTVLIARGKCRPRCADEDEGVLLLYFKSGNEENIDCDLTDDSTGRRTEIDGNRSSPTTALGSLKIITAMENAHK